MRAAAHGSRETDERALLSRVAGGDRDAFRRLYLAYHRRLGGFLMRMLGRLDLTEEVINDTMYIVWDKADTFRAQSRVSTWIMGIAWRQAMKALRRVRRQVPVADGADVHELPDADPAERRELGEWIDRALAALPPKHRVVLELTYFMGYSCEEVAGIVDCPVGTVKTRMHYARRRLRQLLPAAAAPGDGAYGDASAKADHGDGGGS